MAEDLLTQRPQFGKTFIIAMWALGGVALVQVLAVGLAVLTHPEAYRPKPLETAADPNNPATLEPMVFPDPVISIAVALTATGLLLAADAYPLHKLQETYLLFLPLMFFPEAVLNGWLVSIMVGFRPHWIRSFRDEEYLHGK